jgi:filamentous hemagglutinin family protein
MATVENVRPRLAGGVIGLGLGRFAWAGRGVAALAATLLGAGVALAGPEGAQVRSGKASIVTNGATTTIQASNNAIINYRSFSIAPGETVQFIQPSAASRVLNRITGPDPSRIEGSLLSNGIVYIVNRAGVYFAKGALVDVGGIYAAAGSITDANFLSGINRFTDARGAVVNEGTIRAGVAAMVGEHVANRGTVIADGGVVTMAAGRDVYLGERTGQILVKVDGLGAAPGAGAPRPAVDNSGTVRATGGRVTMAAGDMYSLAVRSSGSVKASDIEVRAGRGSEVRVSGTLDASAPASAGAGGGAGGSVRVLGDRVALDGATIDASGPSGGGRVLIGGDYQGSGTTPTASRTYVSADTTISADATEKGDGGTVVVWSDQVTRYYGSISARGAGEGGDGGLVEVSGKETLLFGGRADLTAPGGARGTLLLDPRDITVGSTGAAALGDVDEFGDTPDTDVLISAATIDAAGANVILQANRDITVNAPINMTGAGLSLTLQAGRAITLNSDIATNNGEVTLIANERASAGVVDASRTAGPGFLTFAPGVGVDSGSANINVVINDAAGLTNTQSGNLELGSLTTTGHVLVRNIGPTIGSSIHRSESDALVTASSVAFDASGGGGLGQVGNPGAPMRVTASNVEAIAGSFGVYLDSPTQGLTIGGAALGGLTGISVTGRAIQVSAAAGALTVTEAISQTGGSGPLSLTAADGVTIDADVTARGPATINADLNSDGTGTLAIAATRTVSTTSSELTLVGADLNLAGRTDSGGAATLVRRANGGSIGLGAAAGDMSISNAELANITATGLRIGGPATALIVADGVTAASLDGVAAAVSLLADASGGAVQFANTPSVFHALAISAEAGVAANVGVTTDTGPMSINADSGATGNGQLTVSPGATVGALASALTVAAADVDLNGNLVSGGLTTITPTGGRPMGLGAATVSDGLNLSNAELARLGATSLILGGPTCGSITVDGVGLADLAGLTGPLSIIAGANGASVTFSGGDSRFSAFEVRADDTISVNTNLTAAEGDIHLIADADGAADASDAVNLGSGVILSAAGELHLSASRGGINAAGTADLRAQNGVRFSSDLAAPSGLVTIDADRDANGLGRLVVETGAVLRPGAGALITAADVDLDGSIDAGAGTVTIRRSTPGTVGLGDAAGQLRISGDELGRITAGSLVLGGDLATRVDVTGVTRGQSDGVASITLTAGADGGSVHFAGGESQFRALTANADDFIEVASNLSTTGPLTLNADTDSAPDTADNVAVGGGLTVTAAGALTVTAPTGGLVFTGASDSTASLIATDDGAISLPRITAIQSPTVNVLAQGGVSLADVLLAGSAFTATADTDSDTSSATLSVGSIQAQTVTLGAGTDSNDVISLEGDVRTSGALTIQNAQRVDVADGVDLVAGGALNAASGIGTINLLGASGSTHQIASTGDEVLALASITAANSPNLTIRSEGRVAAAGVSIGSGALDVTVDSDNDGSETANIGAVVAGSVRAAATGDNDTITFDGPVSASEAGGIDARAGAVVLNGNVASTGGPVVLTGSIVVGADLSVSTSAGNHDITFLGPINGSNRLTVSPGSASARFAGPIGESTPLLGLSIPAAGGVFFDGNVNTTTSGITVSASAVRIGGSVVSTADISVSGPVTFAADSLVSGRNITFASTVNSDSTARAVTLASSGLGVTSINGVVGGLAPLASLTTNADGVTQVGADITTLDGLRLNDAVILAADATLRNVGAGGVVLGSTVNSDSAGTPRRLSVVVGGDGGDAAPLIQVGGSIGTTARLRSLSFNSDAALSVDGRSTVPSAATIVFRQRDANGNPLPITDAAFNPATPFVIGTTGDFTMGLNEKLTAMGSLSIQAGGVARLGDLTALGNIAVSASSIILRSRPGGPLLNNQGILGSDSSLDFVTGGAFDFSVAPVVENPSLPKPAFGAAAGVGDLRGTLSDFTLQRPNAFGASALDLAGRTLDLRSTGPTNTDISTVLAGAIPDPDQASRVLLDAGPDRPASDLLLSLGITVRPETGQESFESLIGRTLLSDLVTTPGEAPARRVAAGRLAGADVAGLLGAYRDLFTERSIDPQTGEETSVSKAPRLRESLARALDAYHASGRRAFDAADFRAFVRGSADLADAEAVLDALADLLARIDTLGLTSAEVPVVRAALLRDVTPEGLSVRQLEEAIVSAPALPG